MILRNKIFIILYMYSLQGFSQESKMMKDSLSSNDFHYRIDAGFSGFHFISNSFNPIYHQNLYINVSKNNPKWKYNPGVGFLFAHSFGSGASSISKKEGIFEYYLMVREVKNNFPKKEKCNFYYGLVLGGYYSYYGQQGPLTFRESKILGVNMCPLIGLDQKIIRNVRFFGEIQIGFVIQNISVTEYIGNSVYSDERSREIVPLYSYTPFLLGLSFIIN